MSPNYTKYGIYVKNIKDWYLNFCVKRFANSQIEIYYRRLLPSLFWNLMIFNLACMLPLVVHGRMRENLFKNRGSYNPAIDQLPVTALVFLSNWQIQKRIWNPIRYPTFRQLVEKYSSPNHLAMINRNFNFASITMISITGSWLLANIYQLTYQDRSTRKYLGKTTKPFIGADSTDMME